VAIGGGGWYLIINKYRLMVCFHSISIQNFRTSVESAKALILFGKIDRHVDQKDHFARPKLREEKKK
jgi:hypothetical protein